MKLRKPLNLTVNQRVSGSSPEGGAENQLIIKVAKRGLYFLHTICKQRGQIKN